MLNTCSIGRRWKPREGWSRPVLTGERGTLSDSLVWGSGLVLWWFLSLDGKEHCFLVVTETIPVKRFCSRPLSGSRTATIGIGRVAGSVAGRSRLGVGRYIGFAVVMAQVRRPVPFRTRKLRPGRGDGTALERVWESSAPPHSTVWTFWSSPLGGFPEGLFFIFPLGVPGALRPAGTPIFYAFFRCSLPVACGRLPFHNTPRITWSASVTVINDVMRLTRYVRAGSRESRYDGKRHKPDD